LICDAQLEQVHELVVEPAAGQMLFERQHRLQCGRAELTVVEACLHGSNRSKDRRG
jgi:hypothetical protein